MYSREIEGQVFEFGVSGKLLMNVLVMYDRETDSLWSQLLGEAIQGEMLGAKLEYLPSWQTTWEDWKTRHPDTVALVKGYSGDRESYYDYYVSDRTGVFGWREKDRRIAPKEFVIGVSAGSAATAYPFGILSDQQVINDVIGGVPVLVVFDPQTASGVVFDRRIEGRALTFQQEEGVFLTDRETGSHWDGITGEAISGPFDGNSLTRIKSTSSFWFGWVDFYPLTKIYGQDT